MWMTNEELKSFLDDKAAFYNEKWFVLEDPVSIPHRFTKKEDIEIIAFLTATLAWGQRKMILKKCAELVSLMDNSPHEFLMQIDDSQLMRFNKFVYRTFNASDTLYFLSALKEIYTHSGGLESIFTDGYKKHGHIKGALEYFRDVFLSFHPLPRTGKHVANTTKDASAKRLNMFLRWMVRDDGIVDFGLWKGIPKSALMIPLDVHVGNVARDLGMLHRKQNDWQSVEELTEQLRQFRPQDPAYYDFALFGLGVYESQKK